MSSYATERESESLPGAFPVTPGELEANLDTSDTHQRNKLHKREDPRGWSEEEKAAHRHQYTDSGVGLSNTDRTPVSQNTDSVSTGGNIYDSNKAAITQNREPVPSTTAATTGTTSGTTDYRGAESKPGVMTGAYSQLNDSKTGNNYSESSILDPTKNSHANTTGVGATGPSTGIATAAASSSTAADSEPTDSVRNIVRNGLRESTELDHQDPYWGDVPRGTGIYNGVTGHGSSETPADGSIQARNPELSHDEQRAFPLSTSDATRSGTSPHGQSRFRESLPESAVGAGAGLAASGMAEKHHERKHEKELTEPTTQKHETTEPKKESKIAGLFHRDHKDDDIKHEKKHEAKEKEFAEPTPAKADKPLTDRDAGSALAAATVGAGAKSHADKHDKRHQTPDAGLKGDSEAAFYQHPHEKVADRPAKGTTHPQQDSDPFIAAGYTGIINQQPATTTGNTQPAFEDVTARGHPSAAQTTENPAHHHDSRAGYGLAAAGVGAGAGYAAHKHANQPEDSYKEPITQSSYDSPTTTSRETPQQSSGGYTIGQPQLNVVPGVAGSTYPLENKTGKPTATHHSSSHPDTSTHGQYNTLSDGTPSGVDIGNHYGDKKNVVPTSISSNTTPNTATRDNHSGAKATAAGVGAIGAGAAASHYATRGDGDRSVEPEPLASSSRHAHEPYAENTSSQGGQYKTLPTGTPSGVNVDDGRHHNSSVGTTYSPTTGVTSSRDIPRDDVNDHHRGAKAAAGAAGITGAGAAAAHHHHDNDHTAGVASSDFATRQPGTTATSTQHTLPDRSVPNANRSSTDSSHGGQYNVLSSGTPSGINIGDHHGDAKNTVAAAPTSTSANTHPSTATSTVRSAVEPTTAPKDHHSKPTAAAAATAAGVAGAGATGPSLGSGDKVFHRCKKCGEENDITGYFQDKKH